MFRKGDIKIFCIVIFAIVLGMVALANAADVTLAWDPNDPAPEGYKIYQRVEGETYDYTSPVWTGTETTCTITDLADDITYYFVARAFIGTDESGDSNEATIHTSIANPPMATYPEQPINIAWNASTRTLSWTATDSPDSFIVTVTDSAGQETQLPVIAPSITLSELQEGQTYTASVQSVTGSLVGARSQAVQFMMPITQTIRVYPGQVMNFRFEVNATP